MKMSGPGSQSDSLPDKPFCPARPLQAPDEAGASVPPVAPRAPATAGPISEEQLRLYELEQQIKHHKEADAQRSLLGWAIGKAWRRDAESLASLEKLAEEAREAVRHRDTAKLASLKSEMEAKIEADKQSLETRKEIDHYGGSFLKTS